MSFVVSNLIDDQVKKADTSTRIFSPCVGEIFTAFYSANTSSVVLRLCGLPDHKQAGGYVEALQVKWTLRIMEAEVCLTTVGKVGFDDYSGIDSSLLLPSFASDADAYAECDAFRFEVDVEIVNEYDLDGNLLGEDVDAQWDRFILKETERATSQDGVGHHGPPKKRSRSKEDFYRNIAKIGEMLHTAQDAEREKLRVWLLHEVQLGQHYQLLLEHGFESLAAMRTVSLSVLKEIGIEKLGHRMQMMRFVRDLNCVHIKVARETLYVFVVVLLVVLWFIN